MITELTVEQTAKLPEYANKWIQIGLNSETISQELAEKVATKLYKKAGLETPRVYLAKSPIEAVKKAKELGAKDDQLDFAWGSHDSGSVGFYEFFLKEVGVEGIEESVELLVEFSKLGWTLFYDDACIVCQKPEVHFEVPKEQIKAGELSSLHRDDGPAIDYGDDDPCNIYSLNGVTVERYVVEEPEKITIEDIDGESNAEVRRVKIELFGQDRYIKEGHSEVINEDDFGVLYRRVLEGDEDLYVVKVVNSSPEPDGTFKDYFIRVDPNAYGGLKTARAAIASSWRNEDGGLMFENPEDYELEKES